MESSGLTLEVPDPALPNDVLAKLRRADCCIELTASEVNAWMIANTIDFRREREPDGSAQRVYLNRYTPLSPDLPLMVGDSLFNLRCALDHIIYHLHEIGLGASFSERLQRRSMFVISRDEKGWEASKNRIAELGVPIQELVGGLQPHSGSHALQGHVAVPGPGTGIGRFNGHRWLGVLEVGFP